MTSPQPTATGPAVFEVLWACPFCADNAYFMLDRLAHEPAGGSA
jgi:hypothetical protein